MYACSPVHAQTHVKHKSRGACIHIGTQCCAYLLVGLQMCTCAHRAPSHPSWTSKARTHAPCPWELACAAWASTFAYMHVLLMCLDVCAQVSRLLNMRVPGPSSPGAGIGGLLERVLPLAWHEPDGCLGHLGGGLPLGPLRLEYRVHVGISPLRPAGPPTLTQPSHQHSVSSSP